MEKETAQLKEERSLVYTLILGVCMLLSLLLIGRMLLGRPAGVPPKTEPAAQQSEMQLTEQELGALLVRALPFPPESLTTEISRNGTVSVDATLNRQALLDSGFASGTLRTALLFLPETCHMYGAWQAAFQDGRWCLSCNRAEIGGVILPEQVAALLTSQMTGMLNQSMEKWEQPPVAVRFEDGLMQYEMES